MKDQSLTINIPVLQKPSIIAQLMIGNKDLFSKYPLIVINRNGGERLKPIADVFIAQESPLPFARRFALALTNTKYVLCLDSDVILPQRYVPEALSKLNAYNDIAAVALDYDVMRGHLSMGTSIWRTEVLRKLYDWHMTNKQTDVCECAYMWKKLREHGHRVETVNMRAIHLKEDPYLG